MRTVNSLHNPFINRFNDPVTRRRDEMQCDEYVAWLRERNLGGSIDATREPARVSDLSHTARVFAGLFGLLILVVSFAVFLKAL